MQESTFFLPVPLERRENNLYVAGIGAQCVGIARTITPWPLELSDAYRKLLLWAFKGFRMNLGLQGWGQVQISNSGFEPHRALQEEPWYPQWMFSFSGSSTLASGLWARACPTPSLWSIATKCLLSWKNRTRGNATKVSSSAQHK